MISYDLTLDLNNDLIIKDGDFFIDQTDDQNIEAIMVAEKGQFYEFLLLGYGITRRLYGPFDTLTERKAIRESLGRDNYNVTTLNISSNPVGIELDAEKIK